MFEGRACKDTRYREYQRPYQIRSETGNVGYQHLARAQCFQMMRKQEMGQFVCEHTGESDSLFFCRHGMIRRNIGYR